MSTTVERPGASSPWHDADRRWDQDVPLEPEADYRHFTKAGIACFILGILSLGAFLSTILVLIPIFGLGLGWLAWSNLRRYSDELMGWSVTKAGLALCGLALVGSVAMHSYIYATEVPEGHTRLTFRDLRPARNSPLPFSETADRLDGQPVFIKGYVRPGNRRENLQHFLLVGDFGTCCFGGNPKITDVVAVRLEGDLRVDYSLRRRSIAGIFRLNRDTVRVDEDGVPRVYYVIDAYQVR